MMRGRTVLLIACLGVQLAGQAQADDIEASDPSRAQQLLKAMTEASRTLNYDGVFIYQYNDRMDAMRIIHQAGEEAERERLISLTGTAREVIRNGQSVTCIFPDDQSIMVEKSLRYQLPPAQLPHSVTRLADSYRIELVGGGRIAGRDTQIIEILPRDRFRYGYRLWLDEKTHLLLKSELLDSQGQPLELFMFTQLEILDRVPDELLEPTINGSNYSWYENPDDRHTPIKDDAWQVSWLPSGFTISNRADELLANSPLPVQHLVYSDGMTLVSVFVEPVNLGSGVMIGPSRLGAVHAFARAVDGYQVIVIGEVPPITVRQMANSVAYQP